MSKLSDDDDVVRRQLLIAVRQRNVKFYLKKHEDPILMIARQVSSDTIIPLSPKANN